MSGLFVCSYLDDDDVTVYPPEVGGRWTVPGHAITAWSYNLIGLLTPDGEVGVCDLAFNIHVAQPYPGTKTLIIKRRKEGSPWRATNWDLGHNTNIVDIDVIVDIIADDLPVFDLIIDIAYSSTPFSERGSFSINQIVTRAEWTEEEFNCRKKITVKKETVSGSPRNIPVKVDFPGDDLALYYALTNYKAGALMKVVTESGLEIAAEAGIRQSATDKQIRLFFLAPILSSTEDTVFYLYYASQRTAEMTFQDADVWLPDKTGVWHDGFEVIGQYAKSLGRY